MFIWGSGSDIVQLGQTSVRECTVCEKERNFSLYLQYEYNHIYYIFGSVSYKTYLYACEVCNRGHELNAAEIEKQLGRVPIPWMRRYGGWVFGAIIASIIGVGILSEIIKSNRRANQPISFNPKKFAQTLVLNIAVYASDNSLEMPEK